MNHGTYATEDRFVKMKFIWGCPKGHVCVRERDRESPGSLLQVAPNNYGNGEELTKMIHFSKTIRILCVEPVVLHLLLSPLLFSPLFLLSWWAISVPTHVTAGLYLHAYQITITFQTTTSLPIAALLPARPPEPLSHYSSRFSGNSTRNSHFTHSNS